MVIHVTALLNAAVRTTAGLPQYTANVGDNSRSAEEITETVMQCSMMVATTLCETDSHPWRVAFLENTTLVQAEPLPFHHGSTSIPDIKPYFGSVYLIRGVRKSYAQIEAYRQNINFVYSPINHNAAGPAQVPAPTSGDPNTTLTFSPLAGFYDIVNGIFYFTGYEAYMKLAKFTRTDVLAKLPEAIEPTIIKLSLGMSAKDGDSSDGVFANWTQLGTNDLTQLKSGATVFSPVDNAIQMRDERTA